MPRKDKYPPVPFGYRIKKRIRDETDDLVKSILNHIDNTRIANANTTDQLMDVLKGTEFSFIAQHATEADKQKLFSILNKHPTIERKKGRLPSFRKERDQEIKQIAKTIKKRNPTYSKTKITQLAKAKWQDKNKRRLARGKIYVEKRIEYPVKKWQRLKAIEPSFRPEQYVRQRSRTGKYYNRLRNIPWTTKQENYIKSNPELDSIILIQQYNQRFKTKRSVSSIINKRKRLR